MKLLNLQTFARQAEKLGAPDQPTDLGRWINGRVVGVLASPQLETSQHIASGVSVVPAGTATPWHSHEAEEIAVIVGGRGQIRIGDDAISVVAGDVVLTPSDAPHQTCADADVTLSVLWVYGPAGSESRWLATEPEESLD